MTPEELNVISDAIKILGPALITGLVGYYSAKIQLMAKLKELETKLKELDKNNEFKAREHYFNYYKEQQKEITGPADTHQITSLTNLLYSSSQDGLSKEEKVSFQDLSNHIIKSSKETKAQFESRNMDKIPEYKPLYDKLVKELDTVNSLQRECQEEVKEELIKGVRDLQMSFGLCIHMIEQRNMEECFGKYFVE